MTDQPQQAPSTAGSLALVGGVLALDFCNTSSGRGTDRHIEHLHTVSDLLGWARHASLLRGPAEAQLRSLYDADQTLAAAFFERVLGLREAIYDLHAALARGKEVDQTTVDLLVHTHAACLLKGRLETKRGAFDWVWSVENAPEEVILGPITFSALAILTAADHGRLKRCDGHNCGWLFLDTSKRNNRRWCEMEPCGNRAKQARRRGRQRSDAA